MNKFSVICDPFKTCIQNVLTAFAKYKYNNEILNWNAVLLDQLKIMVQLFAMKEFEQFSYTAYSDDSWLI